MSYKAPQYEIFPNML